MCHCGKNSSSVTGIFKLNFANSMWIYNWTVSLLGQFPHANLDQRAGIKWWWIHNFNFQHKFKVLPKRFQRTEDELTFVTSRWLDHQVTPQLKSLLPWCSVEPRLRWPGIQEPPPTNTPSCQTLLPCLHSWWTQFTVPQG